MHQLLATHASTRSVKILRAALTTVVAGSCSSDRTSSAQVPSVPVPTLPAVVVPLPVGDGFVSSAAEYHLLVSVLPADLSDTLRSLLIDYRNSKTGDVYRYEPVIRALARSTCTGTPSGEGFADRYFSLLQTTELYTQELDDIVGFGCLFAVRRDGSLVWSLSSHKGFCVAIAAEATDPIKRLADCLATPPNPYGGGQGAKIRLPLRSIEDYKLIDLP